jgi:hypothetical protein
MAMTNKIRVKILKAGFVCLILAACASSAAAQAATSLYKRLGGYDAIAAVTDEFIAQLAGDKQLVRFETSFGESYLRLENSL